MDKLLYGNNEVPVTDYSFLAFYTYLLCIFWGLDDSRMGKYCREVIIYEYRDNEI